MKKFLLLAAALLPTFAFAQGNSVASGESAIFDSAGMKVFSLVATGDTEEVVGNDGVKTHRLYRLTDLETGATYTFSPKWDRTMSDGGIYMDYHFNQRQWYWVEDAPVKTSAILADRVAKEDRRRTYKVDSNGMTTPDQGDHPILRFEDGNYIDEMGRPVYSLKGPFPGWAQIVLLHKYYEQVYLTSAFDEIKAWRVADALRFGESNSLAEEMLAQGHHNETKITTLLGKHYKMLYFTEIDGQLVTLSKDQVGRLKNKWLIARDETGRTSSGHRISRAATHLSKREATKRGFAGLEGTDFVLEIKPVPEFLGEFQASLSQAVATAGEKAPTEAARQARMDSLSVGILAGSIKPGSGNGYRTDATFDGPADIAVDSHGNVFVVDGNAVRKITPAGQVSTFAGGPPGYVDGQGVTARFASPVGIAIDATDNLYIADAANYRVRKISPDGYVDTLAGSSTGHQDGWGPNAKFGAPHSIAVDAEGNVYVGEARNGSIRKVTPDGTVSTIGDQAEIKFIEPRSIAVDQAGYAYVLDGAAIKRIAPDDGVLLMAANMTFDAAANSRNLALFASAGGIAVDADGNLFITKKEDHEVVRIAPDGAMTTVAQNTADFWLGRPNAVAVGANGNIYLADSHNKVIHQVTPAGNVGPLPGMHIPKPEPVSEMNDSAPLDPAEAKALFAATKKRSGKDPQAMFELASMHGDGIGTRKDWTRELSSYKKAAKKGHAGAQYELAVRHINGTVSYGLSITNGDVAAAQRAQNAKRQVNAAKLFTQSAEQGYAPAQYALGQAYLRGEGVTQNVDTGVEWLSKAGAQGMLEAQLELATVHRDRNTPEDLAKAIEWYAVAAAQGDTYAAISRNALLSQTEPNGAGQQIIVDAQAKVDQAFAYYTGSGVEQDLPAAAELFYESALLGNTTAQWILGRMYINGEGLTRDAGQGIEWLTMAAEFNHPDAQFYLGQVYDRGYGTDKNADLAYKWYTRSAQQDQLNAQYSLGSLYFDGRSKMVGKLEAREWLEAAANQGDAQAQYLVAGLSDGARATELYEKATAQGHIYAAGQ